MGGGTCGCVHRKKTLYIFNVCIHRKKRRKGLSNIFQYFLTFHLTSCWSFPMVANNYSCIDAACIQILQVQQAVRGTVRGKRKLRINSCSNDLTQLLLCLISFSLDEQPKDWKCTNNKKSQSYSWLVLIFCVQQKGLALLLLHQCSCIHISFEFHPSHIKHVWSHIGNGRNLQHLLIVLDMKSVLIQLVNNKTKKY